MILGGQAGFWETLSPGPVSLPRGPMSQSCRQLGNLRLAACYGFCWWVGGLLKTGPKVIPTCRGGLGALVGSAPIGTQLPKRHGVSKMCLARATLLRLWPLQGSLEGAARPRRRGDCRPNGRTPGGFFGPASPSPRSAITEAVSLGVLGVLCTWLCTYPKGLESLSVPNRRTYLPRNRWGCQGLRPTVCPWSRP